MNVQRVSICLLFFPPPVLSHHVEIELGSVLTINNVLLALDQGFFFDCSDTVVNFSILTVSWVYFESSFTSLSYISMLFHCMYLPPPHSHFSDAVLTTRNMLMGASLQLHQCTKGTFCVMSSWLGRRKQYSLKIAK